MTNLREQILSSVLRHFITIVFTMLATKHYLTADQAHEASESLTHYLVEHLSLYGPVVVAVGWAVLEKIEQKARTLRIYHLLAEALAPAANAPTDVQVIH